MKPVEIKSECRRLYLSGSSVENILLAVKGSTKSTISRWKKEGRWDEERAKNLTASQNTAELLRAQIENIIKTIDELGKELKDDNEEADIEAKSKLIAKYGDVLSKLTKIESSLFKNSSPKENIIFAIGELALYLKDNNLGLDKPFFNKLDTVLAAFTEHSLKKFSRD